MAARAKGTVEERDRIEDPPSPGRAAVQRDADDAKAAYMLFTKSKAKEKTHQAKLAEFKEKELRGQLISAKVMQKEADQAARMVHDAFMALPDRVASVLVGATEQEIMEELRKEVRTILQTLSEQMRDG